MARPSIRTRTLGTMAAALSLSGCATLPSSGPTNHDIVAAERSKKNVIGFRIVDITPGVVDQLATEDRADAARPSPLAALTDHNTNDMVGPGDVLQISVFEVGVSLFGGVGSNTGLVDPAARFQAMPPMTVDRDGYITVPYAGHIKVEGKTAEEIQTQIQGALRSLSQKPQVIVSIRDNVANTFYLFGEVRRPGRYSLTLAHERLVDAIANGGGSPNSSEDTLVRLTRHGIVYEERLGRVLAGSNADVVILPGDRIELLKRPRTFLILGASSRVSQVSFETGNVSLAEAVARAGGPADNQADAAAIFLFRYDSLVSGATAPQPMVYRLNLYDPASYFVAQQIVMRDKDVVYVANAAANQPSKLIGVINQLFSPFVTAKIATQ